jgi:uncharacterized protein (TIGR03067 family)
MRAITSLLIVSTGLVVGSGFVYQDSAKTEAAELQGTWTIVSVELEGQPLAMDNLNGARLTVQGQRYSFRHEGVKLEFTCSVDASKSPKTIDLEVAEGLDKGNVYRGIYQLDQDRYTICRGYMPDEDRPTAFATGPGSGLMMVVWKRTSELASK